MGLLLKRMLGVTACTLGIVGVIVGVIGVFGIWRLAGYLRRLNTGVHARADNAVVLVHDRVTLTRGALQDTRTSTESLKRLAQQAMEAARNAELEATAVAQLEQRIRTRIDKAQDLLRIVQTAAEMLEHLLASVEGDDAEARLAPWLERLRVARAGLMLAAGRLDAAETKLTEWRERRAVAVALAERTARLAAEILAELDAVQERLELFQEQLVDVRDHLAQARRKLSAWITWSGVAGTSVVVWIVAAQAALTMQGWRWLKRARRQSLAMESSGCT